MICKVPCLPPKVLTTDVDVVLGKKLDYSFFPIIFLTYK